MRYVIIGNSIAGVRGAETLRALDKDGEIVMVDVEERPAYSRCLLPDLLEGKKNEFDLQIRPHNFYQSNQITTIFGEKVTKVDDINKFIYLANNSKIRYDKLLIATGASSFIPPIPGIEQDNIFGLRDIEDAFNIIKACEDARRVIVIGAGFVGLEAAYALYRRGKEITVIEKLPRILPVQFDEKAGEILKQDMQAEGIRFILGQGVKEIASPGLWSRLFGQSGKGVILESGEKLKADVIIVATGARANIELVNGSNIGVNRGILVNEFLETNIDDIYAAGDVTETFNQDTEQLTITPIWPNASLQGRIAACNMTGQTKKCVSLNMQNRVEFRDVPAVGMGDNQPQGADYQLLTNYRPERNLYKKLVLKDNKLVGMILVGNIDQAGLYGALIKNQTDISPYKTHLLDDNFNYGQICPV